MQLPQNALITQFLLQVSVSQVSEIGAQRWSAWHSYNSTTAGGISPPTITVLLLKFWERGNKRWDEQSTHVPIVLTANLGTFFLSQAVCAASFGKQPRHEHVSACIMLHTAVWAASWHAGQQHTGAVCWKWDEQPLSSNQDRCQGSLLLVLAADSQQCHHPSF